MATGHDSSSLASSLTDLMTSLAIIFVLLLIASLNNAQQEGETTRKTILDALKAELSSFMAQGVQVDPDPNDRLGLIVLVPSGLLEFEVNKDKIPPNSYEFLERFIPKLAETVCSDKFRKEINSIVVEGHTDSTGTKENNLPLSQRRSMAVVLESLRIFSKSGKHPEDSMRLQTCFLDLLSASGRGSVDLIRDDNDNEDRARSRRVVFKIRVRSIEQRTLGEVLGGSP